MSVHRNVDAPSVVIAPAMAVGSGYYRPLVDEFARHGWTARAEPRRGFEPTGPRAGRHQDWSYSDEIETLAVAVRTSRAERHDRPVVLLGHSLGGQLALGVQHSTGAADALVTVGGCLPHFRTYPYGGLHVAAQAVLVPAVTAACGYLPPPNFGAPGARTMMREWARMALTARLPFATGDLVGVPSLIISLEGDTLAPVRAVDAYAREFFEPAAVTRWNFDAAAHGNGIDDHLRWVKSPEPIVSAIVRWWDASPG